MDTANFWRDAYTKSQETQIALRARILELEASKGRSVEPESRDIASGALNRKRKTDLVGKNEASTNRSQKKAKTGAEEISIDEQVPQDLRNSVTIHIQDPVGKSLAAKYLRCH